MVTRKSENGAPRHLSVRGCDFCSAVLRFSHRLAACETDSLLACSLVVGVDVDLLMARPVAAVNPRVVAVAPCRSSEPEEEDAREATKRKNCACPTSRRVAGVHCGSAVVVSYSVFCGAKEVVSWNIQRICSYLTLHEARMHALSKVGSERCEQTVRVAEVHSDDIENCRSEPGPDLR